MARGRLPARTTKRPAALLDDLRTLIEQARAGVAQAVNAVLVVLYWQVGQRIRREILKERRATYGEQIVPTLSAQLVTEFGDGFSARTGAQALSRETARRWSKRSGRTAAPGSSSTSARFQRSAPLR